MTLMTERNPSVEEIRSPEEGAARDRCARCGGLMVEEACQDFWDAGNATVRRCVQCGDVIDAVILKNRHRMVGR